MEKTVNFLNNQRYIGSEKKKKRMFFIYKNSQISKEINLFKNSFTFSFFLTSIGIFLILFNEKFINNIGIFTVICFFTCIIVYFIFYNLILKYNTYKFFTRYKFFLLTPINLYDAFEISFDKKKQFFEISKK